PPYRRRDRRDLAGAGRALDLVGQAIRLNRSGELRATSYELRSSPLVARSSELLFVGFVDGFGVVGGEAETHVAVEETAEAEGGHVVETDALAGHDPGEDEVGDGGFGVHRAGGEVEDRDLPPVGEPEHAAGVGGGAEFDDLAADAGEGLEGGVE